MFLRVLRNCYLCTDFIRWEKKIGDNLEIFLEVRKYIALISIKSVNDFLKS